MDPAPATPTTCPSSTNYDGFTLLITDVKDVNGASVSDISGYVQFVPASWYIDEHISSQVTDSALAGTYTVEYKAGLSAESDAELATRTT